MIGRLLESGDVERDRKIMLKTMKPLFKTELSYLYDAILCLLPHMYIPLIVNESKNRCDTEVVKPLKTPNY